MFVSGGGGNGHGSARSKGGRCFPFFRSSSSGVLVVFRVLALCCECVCRGVAIMLVRNVFLD